MMLFVKPRLLRFPRVMLIALALAVPLLSGRTAMADDLVNDARIEGYGPGYMLDLGPAPYYLLFAALGVLCASVMFKDAKRADAKK